MSELIHKKCTGCGYDFVISQEDAFWQEHTTYSVKLCKCPKCKKINVVKYKDAIGLYVNTDKRYYT